MSMIELEGSGLTCEQLERIARARERMEFSAGAKERIQRSRWVVKEMFRKGETAYGTTTGIGELASVLLTAEQAREFSRKLVYSHAGGCGEPLEEEVARAALASRMNVLAKGVSGVRLEAAAFVVEMLNRGVTPVMAPTSVGACGDLAPLAQAMLVPLGEGEAFYQGQRLSGTEALRRAGLEPIEYEIRDGLALINGSNVIAGIGALAVVDAERLVKTAEVAAAMSFEALQAVTTAFDDEILRLRGFPGGVRCAANIRRLIEESGILGKQRRVQDAYSIRSTPQVLGAVKDALRYVREQVEIELNAGADNPLFVPKDDGYRYLAGANFQGTPVALPLELLGTGVTTVSVLSERRLNRLLNPALSAGLPGFLTKKAGANSGIMIPQYTAASLVCESRVLCTPAAVGSIPTAADQEDFVSMGTVSARKARTSLQNAAYVVAIELLAAAQALELRGGRPGKGVAAAFGAVRKEVAFLEEDRPLYPDIERLARRVRDGSVLAAAEAAVGPLE